MTARAKMERLGGPSHTAEPGAPMRMIDGTAWPVEEVRAYIEDRVHKVPWSGCWLWDRDDESAVGEGREGDREARAQAARMERGVMDRIGDALMKALTKEPTKDDLLMLRRAARVLRRTTLRDENSALVAVYAIDSILDDTDAPQICEGCDEEGVYSDDEGCYACRSCAGDGV